MVLQLLRHVAGSRNDHGDVYASMHIQPSKGGNGRMLGFYHDS